MKNPNTFKDTWEKLHKDGYKSFSEMILYKHLISEMTKYFKTTDMVLDIGCGTGDVFNWMQDYIESYYGLDISLTVCEKFLNRFANNPKVFYASDCSGNGEIPIKPGSLSLDKVFSCLVFQHIHPVFLTKYFEEARRLLKEDGLFMFHTTEWFGKEVKDSRYYLNNEIGDKEQHELITGGVFCHKEEFILDLFKKNNFDVIEIRSVSDVAELIKEGATWKFYVAQKKG